MVNFLPGMVVHIKLHNIGAFVSHLLEKMLPDRGKIIIRENIFVCSFTYVTEKFR